MCAFEHGKELLDAGTGQHGDGAASPLLFREVQRFRMWMFWVPIAIVTVVVWWQFYRAGHPEQSRRERQPIPDWAAWVLAIVFGLGLPGLRLLSAAHHRGAARRAERACCYPFRGAHIPLDAGRRGGGARLLRPCASIGGWGVRTGRSGKAYSAYGDQGVQLWLKDDERILIGSQRAEELAAALRAGGRLRALSGIAQGGGVRIVVALGGNALLKRGEPLTEQNQRENVKVAARALAPLAREHSLIITHGNGPQVGLLALEAAAVTGVEPYTLDVLSAESEGMIGYMIEQELGNVLPEDVPVRHHPHPGGGRPGGPGLPEPQQAHRPAIRPGGGRAAGPRARLDRRARQRQVPPAGGVAAAASASSSCGWWSGWWSGAWWSSARGEAASPPC